MFYTFFVKLGTKQYFVSIYQHAKDILTSFVSYWRKYIDYIPTFSSPEINVSIY